MCLCFRLGSTMVPIVLLFCLIKGLECACSVCDLSGSIPSGYHTLHYQASGDHIENPGRGFYKHLETHSSDHDFNQLHIDYLNNIRKADGINFGLRVYILDSFVNSDLSTSFLQKVRDDLEVVKSAGWTVAIRFSYINTLHGSSPYGDASKRWMLTHIQQLSPIFHHYEGVISVIQAGFIGVWGEWAFSTYFGDSRHPDPHGVHGLSQQNWQDRTDVLKAIMDSSPKSIHVQVRTPTFKTQIWGSKSPTRQQDEGSHTYKGRTGHHNDCFLASDSDEGTYDDVTSEKQYLALDSLWVPVGGETCARAHVEHGVRRSDCLTALKELKQFHWSFINGGFNEEVTGGWKSQGCHDEIHRDLGYRLSLKSVTLPRTVRKGDNLCFQAVISSTGFAAPYKAWSVRLVLKSQSSGQMYSAQVPNVMTQSWLTNEDHAVKGSLKIPSSLHDGTYQVYLAIYDEKMKNHADYYVLLANIGVPDFAAGLNSLKTTIQVSGSGHSSSTCSSMSSWQPPTHSKYNRVYGKSSTPLPSSGSHGSCKTIPVPNHSFEDTHDHHWEQYHNGFTFTSDSHSGGHAIKVTNGGAWLTTKFSTPIHEFVMTAFSKRTSGSSSSDASDFSIYCDLTQSDGHHDYGEYKGFSQTSHSWHKAELHVNNAKAITKAECYLLYRNFGDGSAVFDDVTFTIGSC